jgi:hypothetical protein
MQDLASDNHFILAELYKDPGYLHTGPVKNFQALMHSPVYVRALELR